MMAKQHSRPSEQYRYEHYDPRLEPHDPWDGSGEVITARPSPAVDKPAGGTGHSGQVRDEDRAG